MAGHLELLMRRMRGYLNQHKKLRYKKVATTSPGEAAGTTVIASGLTELDDFWNGAQCIILSGNAEGQRRLVEDFADGMLTFTNNAFPFQIEASVDIELVEDGSWSGADFKQWLIDAINYLAANLSKSTLREYLVRETIAGVDGLVELPENVLDIHLVEIDGKPAVQIPVERKSRFTSDVYLDPIGDDSFIYVLEGGASAGVLNYRPATSTDVVFHTIPLMTDFDENGNTTFPGQFFDAVVLYACSLAWQANESLDMAEVYERRTMNFLTSKGIKMTLRSQQEGDKS